MNCIPNKHIDQILSIIIGVVWLAAGVFPALAQEPVNRPIVLEAGVTTVSSANFESRPGNMASTKIEASVSYSHFTLNIHRRLYSWADGAGRGITPNGEQPWNSLDSMGLLVRHQGPLGGKWKYAVAGGASWSGETGADGLIGGLANARFIYGFSGQWQAGIGLMGVYNQVKPYFWPSVGLAWTPEGDGRGLPPQWVFSLGFPETSLTWRPYPEVLGLRLKLAMDRGLYGLDRDNPASKNGYTEIRDYVGSLGVELWPAGPLKIDLSLNYHFSRQIDLYRSNGDKIHTLEPQNALGGAIKARYAF